ncbi:NAD(P)-dependent alcohol dehydrogenase [Rhodococcus sp. NPDC060084]|uniref:NAD(P)-dependent alcohol dehydrogenase n=1 Tax=Rhodococcus sp. NPDC060084 TaxID=3347053 RepID=UPI00364C4D10
MTREILTAVVTAPGEPPVLRPALLADPAPDEVIVRLAATGLCATDLHFAHELPGPSVLGHEGAGYVEDVGSAVRGFAPGDKVLATFAHCGTCRTCASGEPAYCNDFDRLNFGGARLDGTSALSIDGAHPYGHFLGQSAFATHMAVRASSLVRLPDHVDPVVVAPYGCGLMTGAGAVFNVLRPGPTDAVAVFGAGAVGLAATMAAVAAGAREVIVVDLNDERLVLAAELGATRTVNPSHHDLAALLADVAPDGVDRSVDTTGVASVLRTAVDCLGRRGTCAVVGVAGEDTISLDWRSVLNGRTVTGVISGSSRPATMIPDLIRLHDAGRFRAEKFVRTYEFTDIAQAWNDTRSGAVVKAVLTF